MPQTLERDLGLYATITISIGAMIGSGIFVLPGLATKIGGPAVILGYYLAGLTALPAALSKSELATAMPEAGGTYLYIDRAMGPLLGTIAGVGAWFSLVFKTAFALVGLGAYLLVLIAIPRDLVALIAIGLAALLLVVNVFGVKQTGRLQATIVTLVLFALGLFVAEGLTFVDQANYHPFFETGTGGLLAVSGFVFVSYAGVTKIASVAEEIENPGRNIPFGMLGSMLLMMHLYTLVVYVIVGVSPAGALQESVTPMALAAGETLGRFGEVGIAVVAVLALTSMANAGILSSTRFPLAMSRDSLAPASLGAIHDRFGTPVVSILFTGLVLIGLIAFVPVFEIAKLASAFKILVFTFVNVALIAFRESDIPSYDPEFESPGYPYVQLFGIVAGLVLLTQLGTVSMVGAVGIIVGGYLWYRIYGRERTEREGVALEAIRRRTDRYSVRGIQQLFATGGDGGLLIGLGPETTAQEEAMLVEIAKPLAERRGGAVHIVRFEEISEQVPLSHAAGEFQATPESFEAETAEFVAGFNAPVEIGEVLTHDIERAVASYVDEHRINLVLGEWDPELFHGEMAGYDVDWYMRNVPADFLFVRSRGMDDVDEIAVIGERGPFSPLELQVGDALARAHDASLTGISAADPDARAGSITRIEGYHDTIRGLLAAPTSFRIVQAADQEEALIEAAAEADMVIASTSAHHIIYDVLFGTLPDRLIEHLDCPVLLVHQDEPRRHTFIRHLLQKFVF